MTMWKCVDSASEKGGAKFTEDLLGMCGSVAWVLDGASNVSQSRATTDANSDAYWLVHRLDEALRALSVEPDLSLREMVATAIARTADKARQEWIDQPEVPPSAALGIIRGDGERTDYLVLADVSVVFKTGEGVQEITDQRVDEANRRAGATTTMRAMLADAATTLDAARGATIPLLHDARKAMNKAGGYWVASLDERAVDHAYCGTVEGVQEVILASDGFMRVLRPFRLIPGVDALFERGTSLKELAARVRDAEERDPDTRRFARWSTKDDLCAQRLRWVE